MRKNGSSALKSSRSVIVVVMMGLFYVHASAVRRAKSVNLIGGAPVTFWTFSSSREPFPEANARRGVPVQNALPQPKRGPLTPSSSRRPYRSGVSVLTVWTCPFTSIVNSFGIA